MPLKLLTKFGEKFSYMKENKEWVKEMFSKTFEKDLD
jgi:hypothetical protein